MEIVAADHERPNHYWELLEFPSEEETNRRSELAETKAAYDRWASCSMASRRSITSTWSSTSRVDPTARAVIAGRRWA
jgi:hypothetical protein